MALVVQMVCLGGSDQNLVDPACDEGREEAVMSRPETAENIAKRPFEILKRFRTAIDRLKRIDEHDLPV
ncbi:hypothetical protein D3C87_1714450 [compost metagenome]